MKRKYGQSVVLTEEQLKQTAGGNYYGTVDPDELKLKDQLSLTSAAASYDSGALDVSGTADADVYVEATADTAAAGTYTMADIDVDAAIDYDSVQFLPANADSLQTLPTEAAPLATNLVIEDFNDMDLQAYETIADAAPPLTVETYAADDASILADAADAADEAPQLNTHDLEHQLNDLRDAVDQGGDQAAIDTAYNELLTSLQQEVATTKVEVAQYATAQATKK